MTGAGWHRAFMTSTHIEMLTGGRWSCSTVTRLRNPSPASAAGCGGREVLQIVQRGKPYVGRTPMVAWAAWKRGTSGCKRPELCIYGVKRDRPFETCAACTSRSIPARDWPSSDEIAVRLGMAVMQIERKVIACASDGSELSEWACWVKESESVVGWGSTREEAYANWRAVNGFPAIPEMSRSGTAGVPAIPAPPIGGGKREGIPKRPST